MSTSSSSSSGISFGGALAVLFIIGLKLGGVIDWSWWWVLSPLWIGLVIICVVAAAVIIGLVIICVVAAAVIIGLVIADRCQ